MPYLTCPECRLSLWAPTTEKADEPCPRCLVRRNSRTPMELTSGPPRRFAPSPVDPRRAPRMGAVLSAMRRSRRTVSAQR
jgi:hypothetical protein